MFVSGPFGIRCVCAEQNGYKCPEPDYGPMAPTLELNKHYADRLKTVLRLRHEPVACRLIRENEEFPACCTPVKDPISHCQAVFKAAGGECLALTVEQESCHVGACVLGMIDTPSNVATGTAHFNIGAHDSPEAAKEMIDKRLLVPFKTKGEVACPLKDADFVPDVVIIADIPERVYWVVPLETAAGGGRAEFSTAPFQCCCEDVEAVPIVTGRPNISIGCFGCRKRTTIKADEMVVGIPYDRMPAYVEHLDRYESGIMAKAKRD